MKALRVFGPNDARIAEVETPQPGPGEVLVAIEYGGICGSDLAYWRHGASGTAILREPLTLGHEVAGHVAALGEDVKDVEIGTRVAIHPSTPDTSKPLPKALEGRDNLYPICRYYGSAAFLPHEQGGFSAYRVARVDQLRNLPENVTTRQGAVAEPLGVALHAVNRGGGDMTGKRVLVNGAGPIGALVVAAAKHRGAEYVAVSDVAAPTLEMAKKMGADETYNVADGDALPENIDVAFEASGVPQTLEGILLAVRRGGRIVQVGNLPADARPVALGQLVTREIEYYGTYRFVDEISDAIQAMSEGLSVEPILTHEFPLEEGVKALETAGDRSTGSSKVLLKIG